MSPGGLPPSRPADVRLQEGSVADGRVWEQPPATHLRLSRLRTLASPGDRAAGRASALRVPGVTCPPRGVWQGRLGGVSVASSGTLLSPVGDDSLETGT